MLTRMESSFGDKVHGALQPIWDKPVKLFTKITGKPSYTLGVPAIVAGVLAWFVNDIITVVTAVQNSESLFFPILGLMITMLYGPVIINAIRTAARDAEQNQGSETIILSQAEPVLRFVRIFFGILALIDFFGLVLSLVLGTMNILDSLLSVGTILMAFAAWAVYVNEPGGKSVFARSFDWVKQVLENTAGQLAPTPAAQLVPIPVRSR